MKVGFNVGSAGSGGSETKCKISAALVPIYRFPSNKIQRQHHSRDVDGLRQTKRSEECCPRDSTKLSERTPELNASNPDVGSLSISG